MNDSRYFRGKSRGFYVTAIIWLIALGVVAFVGLTGPSVQPDSTADTSSIASIVYTPAPTVSTTSEREDEPSSSNTPSIFLPSEVTEVGTPTASFFVMPITGEIIKDFKDAELQYSLTLGDWRLHKAVDIKGITGDRINSAGDGTVIKVYEDELYGLTVEIDHGNEVTATYSGLETASVAAGDEVSANMQIGTLGKIPCESVETTHLHFVMRNGDKYVSPLNMIGVED